MKALVYAGPKQVEVQEVKEPEKQDGKVKLNIRYCGVCGSVTAACQNIADQIDHIILVCPESTHALAKAPNHKSKLLAKIINIHIYATFIYNVGARNTALSDSAECKYLYASILGHYTTVNVAHCLEGLTTSIAVITGKNAPETSQKATEYCHILPSIEHLEVPGSGLLPQRENVNAFLEQLDLLLSDNC